MDRGDPNGCGGPPCSAPLSASNFFTVTVTLSPKFKVKSLGPGLRAHKLGRTDLDLSVTGESADTQAIIAPLVGAKRVPVVGLRLRFNQVNADIDLTGLVVDTDLIKGKAVFHRASYPAGVDTEKELYVKKLPGHDRVRVCPGASNLDEVNSNCIDGFVLTQGSTRLSISPQEGEDFWRIAGITGTGAQGEAPPPSGGSVGAPAPSSGGGGGGRFSLPDPRAWVMVLSGLALLAVYGGYSYWRRRRQAV